MDSCESTEAADNTDCCESTEAATNTLSRVPIFGVWTRFSLKTGLMTLELFPNGQYSWTNLQVVSRGVFAFYQNGCYVMESGTGRTKGWPVLAYTGDKFHIYNEDLRMVIKYKRQSTTTATATHGAPTAASSPFLPPGMTLEYPQKLSPGLTNLLQLHRMVNRAGAVGEVVQNLQGVFDSLVGGEG